MLRWLVGSVFVAVFSLTGSAAEPTKTAIQPDIRVPTNVGFATNVSPDAQAATVLFDNVLVEVDPVRKTASGAQNQTATRTKLVTLEVPYTTESRSLKMTLDIRGFVNTDAAATARLIACAGDATKVVSLTPADDKIELKGKSKATVAAAHPTAKFGNFQDRVEFTVQTRAAKPVVQITLLLAVDHDTDTADAGGAVLVVDSLDLSIAGGYGKLK